VTASRWLAQAGAAREDELSGGRFCSPKQKFFLSGSRFQLPKRNFSCPAVDFSRRREIFPVRQSISAAEEKFFLSGSRFQLPKRKFSCFVVVSGRREGIFSEKLQICTTRQLAIDPGACSEQGRRSAMTASGRRPSSSHTELDGEPDSE
jgi:hypothetical protein